jgi:hypothetical protein
MIHFTYHDPHVTLCDLAVKTHPDVQVVIDLQQFYRHKNPEVAFSHAIGDALLSGTGERVCVECAEAQRLGIFCRFGHVWPADAADGDTCQCGELHLRRLTGRFVVCTLDEYEAFELASTREGSLIPTGDHA